MCVRACVRACVCLWLFPYSGSLAGAIDAADSAHSPGIPARDMVEIAQQPAGSGFWPLG